MPPRNLQRVCNFTTTYTERDADLIEPGALGGTRRFQWHPNNPKVTILDFSCEGSCELVRTVTLQHARYLWAKLIRKGWIRKV